MEAYAIYAWCLYAPKLTLFDIAKRKADFALTTQVAYDERKTKTTQVIVNVMERCD